MTEIEEKRIQVAKLRETMDAASDAHTSALQSSREAVEQERKALKDFRAKKTEYMKAKEKLRAMEARASEVPPIES